jgi:hypothetical protein
MEKLIQHIVTKLEENVLKHKLLLKDQFSLEWSWQEEPSKGGIECTILAHIPTGFNPISIQNKKHLHWKALKSISNMNNEIKFTTSAHILILKQGVGGEERQVHKNKVANRQPPGPAPSGLEKMFHAARSGTFSDSQHGHT